MSKKARKERRSLAAVDDAISLVRLAREMAGYARMDLTGRGEAAQVQQEAGSKALIMLDTWEQDRLVLRCDPDFAHALLETDRDVVVPPACFERFPFHAVMVSFPPFDLNDGKDVCRYRGVLIVGCTSSERLPVGIPDSAIPPRFKRPGVKPAWTEYGAVADHEMVRFAWFFKFAETGFAGLQTITLPWRGEMLDKERTLAEIIDHIREGYQALLDLPGEDLDVLVPLSVALLLYLGSAEPDINRPIVIGGEGGVDGTGGRVAGTKVAEMGFRVGAALREWSQMPSHSGGRGVGTGRRLPPHIRSAHWHRFRVATRDEEGRIVGDRLGERDVDWHYELKWIAPTPVNIGDDGPQPTVRGFG